jgi:hypothetical protein
LHAQEAQPAPATQPAQSTSAAPQDSASFVGANLNITPKRITLDRGKRSASVYIFNQGTVPATFDISIVDRVMLPSGDIKAASELAETPDGKLLIEKLKSAQQLLVVTPRRATLAPGKGQTVRLRITQPLPANDGSEFRSHLTVTTIPPRDTGITAEQVSKLGANELSFQIRTVFGLSIPIILRSGAIDVRGGIENVRVEYVESPADGATPAQRTPVLNFDVLRSGANSLFGNIEIRSANGQDKAPLGSIRGIGVYPEIDHRNVRVPLQRAPKAGEQLTITFTDDDTKPGSVIARSSFTVP